MRSVITWTIRVGVVFVIVLGLAISNRWLG